MAHESTRDRSPAVIAEHVLVTTDGSDAANRAIPLALAAIQTCGSPRVTLLCVLTPKRGTPVHALECAMARAHAEANLQRLAEQLPWRDRVTSIVADGRAADQILHYVEAHDVDLIVISSHGKGGSQTWRMGSTTHKVIASGAASVLVVPTDPEPGPLTSVLVPLDCSARAECVLPLATKLAETHAAELVLAHVVPRPEIPHRMPPGQRERELVDELTRHNHERARDYLEGILDRLTTRKIRARIELLTDTNPGRALERLAKTSPSELVLLCAHGSGCQQGEHYGSTARRLLDSLVKPLWIVQDLPALAPSFLAQSSSARS
ncbi:universal stress protein [Nannocystaceae bacterium ST9]